MTADFEDRVKCYRSGIQVQSALHTAYDEVSELLTVLDNPDVENPFTGHPASDSIPTITESARTAGHNLLNRAEASHSCLGDSPLIGEMRTIGQHLRYLGDSPKHDEVSTLRKELLELAVHLDKV